MAFVLRVRAGNSYRADLSIVDGSQEPIDVTGWTFTWHIRVGAVSHDFSGSPQVLFPNPTTGVVNLHLSPADTAFLTGQGRHWFVVQTAGGDRYTWFDDNVEVDFDG